MRSFEMLSRRAREIFFDVRVLYLLGGLILSIVAHEFVHILAHLGAINSISLFPNLETIISINVGAVDAFSIESEEILAYTVTALVQFVTIIDVLAIHDSRDKKTVEQSVFGSNSALTDSDNKLLLQIISR